jgi:hypothetical protein
MVAHTVGGTWAEGVKNRVLRRILGPKKDEVTGEWRKLHNKELNELYHSPNIIQVIKLRMRWAGYVAHMGEKGDIYRVLAWKPGGKDQRPRHTWEDNIKMYLQKAQTVLLKITELK